MKSISNQFYLEKNIDKEIHRLYVRVRVSGQFKKVYSDYVLPEACWLKKECRTIARSNNSKFKDLPRYFSKTDQANAWIKMITDKIDDLNDRIAIGEEFTLQRVVDYLEGNVSDLVVPIESELLFSEFLKAGYDEHIRYKKSIGKPLAYKTRTNYDYYRRRYTELAGEGLLAVQFNQKVVDRVTMKCLDDPDLVNTSIRSMFGPIKRMLDKAMGLELLPSGYKLPKVPTIQDSDPKLKTRLSISQFEAIKGYQPRTKKAEQARDAIMMTFFGCGMRMSEVIGLRMKFINPHLMMFQYFAKKQNRMSSMYEMSERLWEYIKKYYDPRVDPDTFLLPVMRSFSKLEFNQEDGMLDKKFDKTRDKFNYWCKKIGTELGFPEDFSTHSGRKSFALSMYEATSDIYLVKDLLNHTKIETTIIYLAKNGVKSLRKNDGPDYFDMMYEQEKNKAVNRQQIRRIG